MPGRRAFGTSGSQGSLGHTGPGNADGRLRVPTASVTLSDMKEPVPWISGWCRRRVRGACRPAEWARPPRAGRTPLLSATRAARRSRGPDPAAAAQPGQGRPGQRRVQGHRRPGRTIEDRGVGIGPVGPGLWSRDRRAPARRCRAAAGPPRPCPQPVRRRTGGVRRGLLTAPRAWPPKTGYGHRQATVTLAVPIGFLHYGRGMSADDSMPSAAQVEAAEGGRLIPRSRILATSRGG
jgi:hypothetical protein